MAYKLGVDLIEKERFAALAGRSGTARRFTAAELAFAEKSGRAEEALAAAFAVKEAFFKAASGVLSDTDGIFWQAELLHSPDGRPHLNLPPDLQGRLTAAGVKNIEVSVSHNRTMVLAAVLLSGAEAGEGAQILREIVPHGFAEWSAGEVRPLDVAWAAACLPRRDNSAHKGSFGHTLIVGGAAEYPGAPQMSACAALSTGAGLVTMAVPDFVPAPAPEIIRHGISAPQGYLDIGAAEELICAAGGKIPIVGMGMGRNAGTIRLCERLFQLPQPKVIDADGLFALAQLQVPPKNAVLTPHEGEMARLLGVTAQEVSVNRLKCARQAAELYKSVVVLKGAKTLVVAPDGAAFVNVGGNPGMATGGSGDVLAGIIGAWLAQGMEPLRAAAFGVYIHSLAGDLAAAELSQYAMTAMDIVRFLPGAYRRLLAVKQKLDDGGET